MTDFNVSEMKVMWVIGALERLATLGLVDPNIPFKVSQDGLEIYLEADENRNTLFNSDYEVAEIFKALSKQENVKESEHVGDMILLLMEYKNNREELVKYALSQEFA